MKIKMTIESFNKAIQDNHSIYKIFAPVKIPYRGQFSDTDVIRYEEVSKIQDIEFDLKSHFTGKEAVMPVTETLFYYTENEYKVPEIDNRKILLFLRSCDIHGLSRIDDIYLKNGVKEDFYYKRLRDKIKIVAIGCPDSFRNCFCVSMGTNKSSNYSLGIEVNDGYVFIDIKDPEFNEIFKGEDVNFEMKFVDSNNVTVTIPNDISPIEVAKMKFWDEYDSRCIACGRCNFSCPTCSCYTMQDIVNKDNSKTGERRRVGASCQVPGFSLMAGGHEVREKNGQRMRYKTMHKMYDHKNRFGSQMCVGCGRCDDVCPQYISISSAINKVSNELKNTKEVK